MRGFFGAGSGAPDPSAAAESWRSNARGCFAAEAAAPPPRVIVEFLRCCSSVTANANSTASLSAEADTFTAVRVECTPTSSSSSPTRTTTLYMRRSLFFLSAGWGTDLAPFNSASTTASTSGKPEYFARRSAFVTQPHTKRFLRSIPAEAVSVTVAPRRWGRRSPPSGPPSRTPTPRPRPAGVRTSPPCG